jgi:putative effector of murein hydrolase
MGAVASAWTMLAGQPWLWLALTLAAYMAGQRIQRRLHGAPMANPVLLAVAMLMVLLTVTHTPYATYFAATQWLQFLLGPATVALAVPLVLNLHHVRSSLRSVLPALLAGSMTSALSGLAVVWLFGGTRALALSMATKAVTTPIAMAIAQEVGGMPALTAALAIAGGIYVGIIGRKVLRWMRIEDWRVHGLAAGVAGSGVAAAEVAPLSALAAAFAAIGVGVNGLLTTLVVPFLAHIWKLGG